VVCVGGFALGWGKRVGGTVKNHYPKGLRWRG
jgi:NOL1/NOP2/fmu family ribosome biogenesis protein